VTASSGQPRTFLVEYHYVDDIIRRREAVRSRHHEYLQASYNRGELLLAAALQDPTERGVLILRTPSRGDALSWAAADPVVTAGLVRQLQAHELGIAYARISLDPQTTAASPAEGSH
jgi:uncharacterized protein YciI